MSVYERLQFNQVNQNWLKYFTDIEKFDYYKQFINYIISVYNNYPNISPSPEDLLNPFKFTDPYEIVAIIISNTCERKSLGLAYSSSLTSKACQNIEAELTKEYEPFLNHNIVISDPSFRKLALQGVFMPNINLFEGFSDQDSPDCVNMFWNGIFKFLSQLGCIVWFAWGSDIETYINGILEVKEDDGNKKKPDEKIKVSTNPKIKDNKPSSAQFKGLGCFNICNKYIKCYHRNPINWLDL